MDTRFVYFCALIGLSYSAPPSPQQTYDESYKPINGTDRYIVYWSASDDVITMEIQAETLGYVGFGISESGDMKGADIVIGTVINGTADIKVRLILLMSKILL